MSNETYHRRSKRIRLEIVVLINARTRDGKSSQGHGFTRTVNVHGGLMDAPFRMALGQHFTLTNPHSKKEANCRVLQVGPLLEGFFPIAFEFLTCNAQFWPVNCPPSDWTVTVDRSRGER